MKKDTLRKILIIIGALLLSIILSWIGLAPRSSSNDNPDINNSEISYNVIVYDKFGNEYTTGLYIKTAYDAWIKIEKGSDYSVRYLLIDSDKEEYRFMTAGKNEIEPLYVK